MGWKKLGVLLEMHDSKPGVGQGLLAAEGVERESMQQREEKDLNRTVSQMSQIRARDRISLNNRVIFTCSQNQSLH